MTFDVEWLWIASDAAITAAGPIAQPQRQPVIAYAFDADPQMHRQIAARAPPARAGRLCGTGVVDQLLVAEIDDDPDALPRGRLARSSPDRLPRSARRSDCTAS